MPSTNTASTGSSRNSNRNMMDTDYDYKASSASQPPQPQPQPQPISNTTNTTTTTNNNSKPEFDGEDALLDLAQLEELHNEAEKMKALGNKHMAAQEYTKAYNAYSAALQLAPVGPSSHVYLSNRAAALLSLKRYQAAATDAKRSAALAPTFGKAHARLGQALYFLKDYEGAVLAYQDAMKYEPDNQVTKTYLEKAKVKMEKKRTQHSHQKQQQHSATTPSSTTSVLSNSTLWSEEAAPQPSVMTTDPNQTGLISSSYQMNARSQPAFMSAVDHNANKNKSNNEKPLQHPSLSTTTTPTTTPRTHTTTTPVAAATHLTTGGGGDNNDNDNLDPDNHDPDLEEALRIQHRANLYLAQKKYTAAIEEYTAALFLVPDDVILSPNLHLGRAHALNGSRRHERAKSDAIMAIRLQPSSPAAYSTLAKSLFYLKDFRASVEAFEKCAELLEPQGERLGMFDQAYLQKAEAAIEEEEASLQRAGMVHGGYPSNHQQPHHHAEHHLGGGASVRSGASSVVPKLPPPRFVPREEALQSTPSVPPMPRQWPQQHQPKSPSSSSSVSVGYSFKCGPERPVVFLSESLGVKLNRGSDGMVRVLWVAKEEPGSPIARQGQIAVGCVVREAAGVDLRRPITNVMWGDTVALIKMAPRPITLVVAQELSEVPHAVVEEIKRAHGSQSINNVSSPTSTLSPSPASGDDPVAPTLSLLGEEQNAAAVESSQPLPPPQQLPRTAPTDDEGGDAATEGAAAVPPCSSSSTPPLSPPPSLMPLQQQDEATTTTTPTAAVTDLLETIIDQAIHVSTSEKSAAGQPQGSGGSGDGEDNDQKVKPEQDIEAVVVAKDDMAEEEATATTRSNFQDSSFAPPPPSETGSESTAAEVVVVEVTPEQEDLSAAALVESVEPTIHSLQSEGPVAVGVKAEPSDELVSLPSSWPSPPALTASTSRRLDEDRVVGGEILFQRLVPSPPSYNGWDNLRWLSFSGERKVALAQTCYRLVENNANKKGLSLWSVIGQRSNPAVSYEPRCLAIYDEPPLILVLRKPASLEEVNEVLGLPDVAELGDAGDSTSSLNNYWLVESVVDPVFCKLRLSSLTTVSSLPPSMDADDRRRSCFELITPHESIYLSTVRVREEAKRRQERSFADSGALMETSATETALVKSLCSSHERQFQGVGAIGADIAWKHQFILGTFHSYVVSADVKSLDEAIQAAKTKAVGRGPGDAARVLANAIDELDDNGLTPLYYACTRRMSHAATSLVGAGADIGIRVGNMNTSLAHICARNLDHKCLSVILSASTSPALGDSIANAVDELGRTPMYLAVTEGTTVSGGSDAIALSRCIMALEAWGGQLCLRDSTKPLQHPVSLLAGMWSPEELSIVLYHTPVRYPLGSSLSSASEHDKGDNNDNEEEDAIGMSLSALYQYPVHRAVSALKTYVDSTATEDELSCPESRLVRTLRLLLEHSFEPNERLEVDENDICWSDEFVGFTPLQILASVALGVGDENQEKNGNAVASVGRRRHLINEAAEFLVRNGARISIESPPTRRTRRSMSGSATKRGSPIDGGPSSSEQVPNSMGKLKLDSKEVLQVLGGDERLKKAQKEWAELRSVDATSKVRLSKNDKASFSENDAPGGNSDKSCAICWSEFGTVLNRKHRCRVTRRFVCDACSGKRLTLDGAEYRVTDGQFLLARIDAAKAHAERALAKAKADEERTSASEEGRVLARIERLEAQEQVNRDSLFGGLVEQATNFVFGEEADEDNTKTSRNVEGLAASMNETRNALLERGDKLASLGEKSSQMVDASADFAKMAKELRRKTESQGLFW